MNGLDNELRNPQERLVNAAEEASSPRGFAFVWEGGRVPEKITISDPTDPEGQKMLINEEVGYMRDGIIMSKKSTLLGTYERAIDYVQQEDGTYLNAIFFHPVDEESFMRNLFSR